MPGFLAKDDLVTELQKLAGAFGLTLGEGAQLELTGETESIRAKWWLGGRKISYRMSCRPSESDHTVHFREAIVERSWGIPPPTFTVETTTQAGWKRSGERRDASFGGGGSVDYAQMRHAVEKAVAAAGWQFHLDGGRMP
jgi:hypothetical protein